MPLQECTSGQFLSLTYLADGVIGSAGKCQPCQPRTYRGDRRHRYEACIEWTRCDVARKQYQVIPPTTTSDRVCGTTANCNMNQYEFKAPTKISPRLCKPLTDCQSGQHIVKKPAEKPESTAAKRLWTSDRTCADCDGVTEFSRVKNQKTCTTMTQCAPGEKVQLLGSKKSDLTCESCAPNTYSLELNRDTVCADQIFCDAGEQISKPGLAPLAPLSMRGTVRSVRGKAWVKHH